jgi:flagellar protein FliS
MNNGFANYRTASIQTADRGKLVVMVYDHCIQWCDRAMEAGDDVESRTKAINKIQDGITELTCALDMDKGGEIAKNLWRLYDFMNWKLQQVILRKGRADLESIREMLADLRGAWVKAAEEVRRTQPSVVSGQMHPMALVG